ncbi:putative membrane protein [Synechococcus sp. SYN20]|nr:putative membrane protein [Synechococcus sp. SYN20]
MIFGSWKGLFFSFYIIFLFHLFCIIAEPEFAEVQMRVFKIS